MIFYSFLLGRHKLAIEAYRQAETRSEKQDWEIYHNLGMLKFDTSVYVGYYLFLGVCMMYLKEYDEAREEISRALNLYQNNRSFVILGKIYLLQGDIEGAIEVYKVAVS